MKSIFAALMLLFVSTIGAAQPVGHKITVNIQDLDEGPVLLAYHFGKKKILLQTALLPRSNGKMYLKPFAKFLVHWIVILR